MKDFSRVVMAKFCVLNVMVVSQIVNVTKFYKIIYNKLCILKSFPGGSDGKESAFSAGDLGSIPGSGRSPRKRNGSPPQYSCLENSMDRGAWWATVHGVTKSDRTEQLTLSSCILK